MKIKKCIGSFILMLSAIMINEGNASIATIGVEEMPESIKKLR